MAAPNLRELKSNEACHRGHGWARIETVCFDAIPLGIIKLVAEAAGIEPGGLPHMPSFRG